MKERPLWSDRISRDLSEADLLLKLQEKKLLFRTAAGPGIVFLLLLPLILLSLLLLLLFLLLLFFLLPLVCLSVTSVNKIEMKRQMSLWTTEAGHSLVSPDWTITPADC